MLKTLRRFSIYKLWMCVCVCVRCFNSFTLSVCVCVFCCYYWCCWWCLFCYRCQSFVALHRLLLVIFTNAETTISPILPLSVSLCPCVFVLILVYFWCHSLHLLCFIRFFWNVKYKHVYHFCCCEPLHVLSILGDVNILFYFLFTLILLYIVLYVTDTLLCARKIRIICIHALYL